MEYSSLFLGAGIAVLSIFLIKRVTYNPFPKYYRGMLISDMTRSQLIDALSNESSSADKIRSHESPEDYVRKHWAGYTPSENDLRATIKRRVYENNLQEPTTHL